MALSADTPRDFSRLARPPRNVPPALRAHLLTGPVMLFGAVFFAFGSIFCFVFVPATDPFGAAELSRKSATAIGWLTNVEKTGFSEGGNEDSEGTPIYRYEYSFRLPDGAEHRGTSYAVGQILSMPPSPEVSPNSAPVQVEYSPGNPRCSRIKGMRTAPLSSVALFVLLFPLIGGLLTGVGAAWRALRNIRLLRDGEVSHATITGVRGADGKDATLEGLKRSHQVALEHLSRQVQSVPVRSFMALWGCGVKAIMGFGVALCLFALGMTLFGNQPMNIDGPVVGVGILGFMAVWVAFGCSMLWFARRMTSRAQGGDA
ncbi:MAG: DUF3592 domain-containing protein, partial [Planctomycetota bacterium]|nr:DUF3592 domain-containing protein [Planctomycetota bacterium]